MDTGKFFDGPVKDGKYPYLDVFTKFKLCEKIALFCGYKKGTVIIADFYSKGKSLQMDVYAQNFVDPYEQQQILCNISQLRYTSNIKLLQEACKIFLDKKSEFKTTDQLTEFEDIWNTLAMMLFHCHIPEPIKETDFYDAETYNLQQAAIKLAESIDWYNSVSAQNIKAGS
jgi:hypothetical protein